MKRWTWIKSKLPWPASKSQFIVAAVLLLLLPLLATMQYRLLGKVSEGERERMKSNLQASANRFSLEFDQEAIRVYSTFLAPPAAPVTEPGGLLSAAFSRWHESAAYPKLIKGIYLASWKGDNVPHLSQLNPETGQLGPSEWPAGMAELRKVLEQRESLFGSRREGGAGGPHLHPIMSLTDRQPALLFQVVDTPPGPPQPNERERANQGPLGIAIVTLDLTYLQQELLPAMVRHHFVEGDQQSYDMAIVTRDEAPKQVWRWEASDSAAGAAWDYAKSDLSIRVFNLRPEILRQQMRRSRQPNDQTGPGPMAAPAAGIPRLMTVGGRLIFSDEMQGLWDLHLRHHAGSLDAAVASARRTNLMISFAILLMLTASFLLMMISSMRARRLAQEQMNFVAGISHELRTPLAVIDSAGYNMIRGYVRRPEAMQEYGQMIRTECRRLGEMVEQVLDFATIRSGRQTFDHHPISLTQIIDEAVRASQPLIEEGGFRIEQEVAAPLPEVMADRQALVRALRNLLSNAMKYGGEDRWIGLRASVAQRGKQELVTIAISDHGRGIPREDLSRIFEPFYRGSDVRSAQIQGNGLGLSLVKNIIEAHHGTIHVESQPGRGASFIITLPAASPETEPARLLTQSEVRPQ